MSDLPELPAAACDCHTHVIGARADYPMVAQRHYTPGPASHEDLLAHLARHGLQRVVIVQPSVYSADNRCMLDSLDRLQGAGRGVAVLDEDVDTQTLRDMHRRGVRGLRLNMESTGLRDADTAHAALARWGDRIAGIGWHLQLYATLDVIVALADRLAQLPVAVVLDHFAMAPATLAHDDARARALQALLRSGNAYIKLSAPYRLACAGMQGDDAARTWAAAFLRAAPRHVLWGSDWPHTAREPGKAAHDVSAYRTLPEGTLARSLRDWLPTARFRQQVLVENPARLYAF
ncbi:amidohydrolase family protein [Cupriavidus sp. CV2]|uniref:amidohydrolase family protein n=1 Tax=Cupriavidus ulmosensis TaxID=3065913 RepID=UPI00296B2CE1|nr:amidohydrolase family protein [Cupriavidus sp. CV2]MDW3681045.1 amidohydrolase family protein [Cupriavidus sp. CV2]